MAARKYDPKERAREKQRARARDAVALAAGEKSAVELRRENVFLRAGGARINFKAAKPGGLW